ncbi:ABC transporter ATP-binding protein [Novosphingobium sp. YJ-S2-02]|uniref:ABC transporter ATP-binding protein n=1 Tax=Novosphingobium aureum TaxID=2792964 RepID=A0A931MMI2_9SPHN|nr:ABC transporter ATP-binding protein [Novosphingobium aureum]MBH0114459.1 ABC transporter ATP-binding protein [Novosphingobium aureum]
MSDPVLAVEHLSIAARASGAAILRDVSFSLERGRVLGIVGESGSGKSTLAMAIAGLLAPGLAVSEGSITLEGQDLAALSPRDRRRLNGSAIGYVFQDPLAAFNPVRPIGSLLIETLMRHRRIGRSEAREIAAARLAQMQLPDPEGILARYPHELSGGQRQRVMIALAVLNDPGLLIADEPTTALDATVQLGILALLRREAATRASILITHDLGVAVSLCDEIIVLREGAVVERGGARALVADPREDYTRMLVDAAASFGLTRPAPTSEGP